MKHGIALPLCVVLGMSSPAQALDLDSVLNTLGLGAEASSGLIPSADGIELDGLALTTLGESTVVGSPSKTPLASARLLQTPTEEGQVIARVRIGEGIGSEGLDLDNLLDSLSIGAGESGEGGVLGGVLDSVTGLTGDGQGDGIAVGGLVGGLGGEGGVVGGLVDTIGDLTGGVLD